MRKCTKCGIEKPLTDFHLNKYAPDSRRSECKECRSSCLDALEMRQTLASENLSAALGMCVIPRKKKVRGGEQKPVIGTCVNTGAELWFDGLRTVEAMGFVHQNVWKVLNGKTRTHKQYTWRYDERNVCS